MPGWFWTDFGKEGKKSGVEWMDRRMDVDENLAGGQL